MSKNIIFEDESTLPEEQLRYLSMTDDMQGLQSQNNNNVHKWVIEPWQKQHQNPSESPQRRPYAPKVVTVPSKSEKTKEIKLGKQSSRILEPTIYHNTFRVKPTPKKSKNCSIGQIKQHSENKRPETRMMTQTNQKQTIKQKLSTTSNEKMMRRMSLKLKEEEEDHVAFHFPVNPIVYPMVVTESKKRRLFRKMDKFQNFVTISLRK